MDDRELGEGGAPRRRCRNSDRLTVLGKTFLIVELSAGMEQGSDMEQGLIRGSDRELCRASVRTRGGVAASSLRARQYKMTIVT